MNSLSMSLAACPQLVQYLECAACKQPMGQATTQEIKFNLGVLVGTKYAVCPTCLQEVEPDNRSPRFKGICNRTYAAARWRHNHPGCTVRQK